MGNLRPIRYCKVSLGFSVFEGITVQLTIFKLGDPTLITLVD